MEIMFDLPGNSVDAIVTDPPYGLEFMGKEWDRLGAGGPVRMQAWHSAWAVRALHVLKPGGHLLAFGGTRTYHRLVCALEDAGFEIRDTLAWIHGEGFPKSHNLGNGWGTALKPAHEPIVLARKPLSEKTVAANVLRWGTGALNVDGCRIGTTVETWPATRSYKSGQVRSPEDAGQGQTEETGAVPAGRWPANLILDEEAAALLDKQSGDCKTGAVQPYKEKHLRASSYRFERDKTYTKGTDSGGASRFFYVAKASSVERSTGAKNNHPTVKPVQLVLYLVKLVTPPKGVVLDPFHGEWQHRDSL